jgi:hypothetical protein
VTSPAPDAVAVVIYRDGAATAADLREAPADDPSGLAMISETRTVDLPSGRSRIRFEGVSDGIIPASAAVEGLPGKLVERDFDYDLLDPASLIRRSLGGQVTLRRLDRRTGRVTEEPATLLSGPDGVTVRTAAGGIEALGCGSGPQALVFDHLPEGLASRPTLSIIADAPRAGRYRVTLSYLTVRLAWSADYVARLSPDGRTLDLTGWLTIANRGDTGFAEAPTAVVAGNVNRTQPDLPGAAPRVVSTRCWPMGTTSDWRRIIMHRDELEGFYPASVAAVIVTAQRRLQSIERVPTAITAFTARESDLGDYKLYTLPEPTTVAAHETKQVRFLHLPDAELQEQGKPGPRPLAAVGDRVAAPAPGRPRDISRRSRRARRAGGRAVRDRRGAGERRDGDPADRRLRGPGQRRQRAAARGRDVHARQRQARRGHLRGAPGHQPRRVPHRRRVTPARAEGRQRRVARDHPGERDDQRELHRGGERVTPLPLEGRGSERDDVALAAVGQVAEARA